MAKLNRRGKGIKHLYVDPNGIVHQGWYNNGRGTCPVCRRTGVKVIFDPEGDKGNVHVCKRCNTAIGRGKFELPTASGVAEE